MHGPACVFWANLPSLSLQWVSEDEMTVELLEAGAGAVGLALTPDGGAARRLVVGAPVTIKRGKAKLGLK